MPAPGLPPLYAILDLPAGGDPDELLRRHRRLLAAGVRLFQIRAKELPSGELLALARALVARGARVPGALLVVNDRVDVALLAGAAGAHLGAEDLPLREARRLAPDLILGATVRTAAGARRAVAAGASYVAIGPVAPTATKLVPAAPRSLAQIRDAARAARPLPLIAVGGIAPGLAAALYGAGASSLAVSSALAAPDPAPVVEAFLGAWRASRRGRR